MRINLPPEPSKGLYGRIVRHSGGLSEGFPTRLEAHRIEPAATVVQLPALCIHLVYVQTAAAIFAGWVELEPLLKCVLAAPNSMTVEKTRAGEVLTAS
jgi:hypothetical protein